MKSCQGWGATITPLSLSILFGVQPLVLALVGVGLDSLLQGDMAERVNFHAAHCAAVAFIAAALELVYHAWPRHPARMWATASTSATSATTESDAPTSACTSPPNQRLELTHR